MIIKWLIYDLVSAEQRLLLCGVILQSQDGLLINIRISVSTGVNALHFTHARYILVHEMNINVLTYNLITRHNLFK